MPRRIIAVAPFPPPVHGMAVAVEHLVAELERTATVRRVSVAAPGLVRSPQYHGVRIGRVVRGLALLVVERRRCASALFSCDGGAGLLYTFALTVLARVLGYRMHLQHHSYAYINRRSPVLAVLVRATGNRCVHLVSCPQMEEDFVAVYPTAVTRVVAVAATIAPEGERVVARSRPDSGRLVLGFLGNVTLDKGLDLALSTARAGADAGLELELRVAGPVVDTNAERMLADAERGPDVPVTRVGPVYGPERDAFLDDLDVFLFPSRYVHESFGLVAWEAMARGVPLVARRSGCLTAAAIGDAGVVVEHGDDFVAVAVKTLLRWSEDSRARRVAARAAETTAQDTVAAAKHQSTRFCLELAGVVGGRRESGEGC